jgi:hypothetical protein
MNLLPEDAKKILDLVDDILETVGGDSDGRLSEIREIAEPSARSLVPYRGEPIKEHGDLMYWNPRLQYLLGLEPLMVEEEEELDMIEELFTEYAKKQWNRKY